MSRITRRQALRLAAFSIAAGAVAACGLGRTSPIVAPAGAPKESGGAQSLTATPTLTIRQPLGGGPEVSITPIGEFYNVAISQRTDWFSKEAFVLRVSGQVDRPLTLTLDEIRGLPIVEQMRTLECIGNPVGGNLISNAMWKGVRLGDVLQRAGLRSTAIEIKFRAADGYSTAIPVSLAMHPDSLLAFEMNGVPLPPQHGAPLRVLLPGRYGQKQPKWITSIEAITENYLGHWERQGWSNDAIVKVNSQIRTPEESEIIGTEIYPVSGTVFANESGVAKVEISTDGGKTWAEARLVRGPTSLTWCEWRHDWPTPPSGDTAIIARATDNDGNQQPLVAGRILLPDSGLEGSWTTHRVAVAVRK